MQLRIAGPRRPMPERRRRSARARRSRSHPPAPRRVTAGLAAPRTPSASRDRLVVRGLDRPRAARRRRPRTARSRSSAPRTSGRTRAPAAARPARAAHRSPDAHPLSTRSSRSASTVPPSPSARVAVADPLAGRLRPAEVVVLDARRAPRRPASRSPAPAPGSSRPDRRRASRSTAWFAHHQAAEHGNWTNRTELSRTSPASAGPHRTSSHQSRRTTSATAGRTPDRRHALARSRASP